MANTHFTGPVFSENGFVGEFTGGTGSLALTDTLSVGATATFYGAVGASGAVTADGTLAVGATATFGGKIGATGSITTASTLSVGATATFNGAVGATGSITTASTLAVGATATFNGAVGATGSVTSTAGFVGAITLKSYTVATAATFGASGHTGMVIYVSDGATGSPVVAFSDGTDWLRCDTLSAIAAS